MIKKILNYNIVMNFHQIQKEIFFLILNLKDKFLDLERLNNNSYFSKYFLELNYTNCIIFNEIIMNK